MHTERGAGPGHMPLLVSMCEVLWGFCATYSCMGHFKPTESGLGSLTGVSSKGCIGVQVGVGGRRLGRKGATRT